MRQPLPVCLDLDNRQHYPCLRCSFVIFRWNVEGVFSPPCSQVDCTKVPMSGLKDDWEDRLDGYIKGVHELEAKVGNVTRGWFLGGKRA